MKAIDAVIAISKALDGWDGTPEQAADKLGAAVAIVKTYATTPAPELTTTDWDRQEARKFLRQLEDEGNKTANELFVADAFARIRAKAKAEALREAAERACRFVEQFNEEADEGAGDFWTVSDLRAAILADEPNKEE